MSEEPQEQPASPSSGAVQRARADLQAGREWKARERLVGHLAAEYDAEALELLGEVSYAMRDLPAAGAAWFGTSRRGKDVDEAVEAWRERHGDHFAQMWSSLPRSVRELEGNKRVDALRRRAEQVGSSGGTGGSGGQAHAGQAHASQAHASQAQTGQTHGGHVRAAQTRADSGEDSGDGGPDAATIIALALGAVFVACAVIGLVTVLGWLVPG